MEHLDARTQATAPSQPTDDVMCNVKASLRTRGVMAIDASVGSEPRPVGVPLDLWTLGPWCSYLPGTPSHPRDT